MTPHRRVILLAGFPSLLALVSASPVPVSNTTTFRPRDIVGDNDWLNLDSVGMMLPSTEGNSLPGMSNLLHAGDGLLPRSDEHRYASRDVVRRDAIFGVHRDTGESLYVLKRDADDGEEADNQGSVDGGYDPEDTDQEEVENKEEQGRETDELDKREEEEDDNDLEDDDDEEQEEEEEEEKDPEDYDNDLDKRENHELAARHESLLKGISVLGAPTFSRRNEGWLSRLFRRRKSKSSKRPNSKQSSRKNRNRSKKNKKQRKSKSKKGKGKGKGRKNKSSGAFDLKNLDLMKGATILTTITWYTGIDLLNPFCDRKTRWTPTDDSLIIAVTEKWSKRPSCGEFMEITTTDEKKARSVIARIVDLCGGCIPEVAHADLSKAAFRKLYDLDVGRVHGLKMRRVGAPKRWSEKLYGPRTL